MHGYIKSALHNYQHPAPTCAENAPHKWNPPVCGAETQYVEDGEDIPALSPRTFLSEFLCRHVHHVLVPVDFICQ
jgi:hypothetical protein